MTDETPDPEQNEDVEASVSKHAKPAEDVEARRKDSAPAEDVEAHARPFVDPPGSQR
jgi:hypothetical protein